MINLDIKPRAVKFITSLPPKQKRQVKDKVLSLQTFPMPHDSKKLLGYENYNRVDIGEYRIIYRYEEKEKLITVVLAGKRNGDEIYKIARRVLK